MIDMKMEEKKPKFCLTRKLHKATKQTEEKEVNKLLFV